MALLPDALPPEPVTRPGLNWASSLAHGLILVLGLLALAPLLSALK